MFGGLLSPTQRLPKTFRELRNWARAGLIKPVHDASLVDETVAEVLAVVRRHIVDGDGA